MSTSAAVVHTALISLVLKVSILLCTNKASGHTYGFVSKHFQDAWRVMDVVKKQLSSQLWAAKKWLKTPEERG